VLCLESGDPRGRAEVERVRRACNEGSKSVVCDIQLGCCISDSPAQTQRRDHSSSLAFSSLNIVVTLNSLLCIIDALLGSARIAFSGSLSISPQLMRSRPICVSWTWPAMYTSP
jgi:hypothetical protein